MCEPIDLANVAIALGEVAVARGIHPHLHAMGFEIDLPEETPAHLATLEVNEIRIA